MQTSATPASPRPTAWAAAAALVAAIVLTYAPAFSAGFVWDDDTHLSANVLVEPHGLYRSWFTTDQHNYWPVTWTVLWLQWKLWGLNPAGFHAVTVLLHAACAVLVWRTLRNLAVPGAWLAALYFGLHPVNVETGAWITQQKNLLSMLGGLFSVLLFCRYLDTGRRRLYAGALLSLLASMLAKTATVTFPAVLLACVWWKQRRAAPAPARRGRHALCLVLPFLGVALALSAAEVWFQYTRAMAADVRGDALLARLAGTGQAVFFYLSKIVRPADLCFVYPDRHFDPAQPLAWVPLAALAAVFAAAFWKRRAWGGPVLFGLGYGVVTLLPVLGLLNVYFMRYAWVSDHWQYIASVGPIALVTAALTVAARRAAPAVRWLACAGAGLLAAALARESYARAAVFASDERLWTDTLAKNPEAWMAHNNYALLLLERGRPDEALRHLDAARAWRPDELPIRLNTARALERKGETAAAILRLRSAPPAARRDADLQYELGRLLLAAGQPAAAGDCFRAADGARPGWSKPAIGLALVAQREGRTDDAIGRLEAVLRRDPSCADASHALAEVHFDRGDFAAAARGYRLTLRAAPAYPDIHNDLGIACARAGRFADAVAQFEEALRVNPGDDRARRNLETARRQAAAATPRPASRP